MKKTIDNVTYLEPEYAPLSAEEKAFLDAAPLISNDNEYVTKDKKEIIHMLLKNIWEQDQKERNANDSKA